MKNQLVKFALRIQKQHLQVAFALLALVLLVLGAGAPEDGGIGGGLR
jgi:hypothetical protein